MILCINAVSANEVYVNTTGNDTTGTGTIDNPYYTIQTGIDNLDENGTIKIGNGTYSGVKNTNITIDKNMNIIGESQSTTIIDGNETSWIFHINSGVSFTIKNITFKNGFSGGSGGVIFNDGTTTVTNCTFNDSKANIYGGAIISKNTLNVFDSSFNSNYAAQSGGAVRLMGSGNFNGCNFTNNSAVRSGGAISIWNNGYNTGSQVNGCSFVGNTVTSELWFGGGAIYIYQDTLTAIFNRFNNNSAYKGDAIYFDGVPGFSVLDNWWGSNNPDFSKLVYGGQPPAEWLFMTVTSDPSTLYNTQNSTITVSFNNYSLDGTNYIPFYTLLGHIPDGTPVKFSLIENIGVTHGTLTPPLTLETINGIATILFTASSTGIQQINATTDENYLTTSLNISPASYVKIYQEFRNLPWGQTITTAFYNDKIYALVNVNNMGPDSTSISLVDILNGLTWTGNYYVLHAAGSYIPTKDSWVLNDPTCIFNGTHWNISNLNAIIGGKILAIELIPSVIGNTSSYAQTVTQSSYSYLGNDNNTSYLTVEKIPTSLNVNNIRANQGNNVILEAILTDNHQNPINGEKVEFWIDNIKVGENTTDNTGKSLLNYQITEIAGSHSLEAIFNGTTIYGDNAATGLLYVPSADLYIQIPPANPTTPNNPFTIGYKLGNNGPDEATNVVVNIPIPDNFVVTDISGDGTWVINKKLIIWNLATVPKGDPYLYITGYTTQPGTYSFGATITSDTYIINRKGVTPIIIDSNAHVNAASTSSTSLKTTNTITMQATGIPLAGIILAFLMILGGFVNTSKKQKKD